MRKVLILLSVLCFSSLSHAEYLGFPNGRTADLTRLPDLSLELGYSGGDFGSANYQNIGLRVNYRLSPGMMLLGDIAMSELGSFDDTAMGVGLFYSLDGLFENMDAAVKGSYHVADYGSGIDVDVLAVEFLVSGLAPISSNGMMWYANVGLHRNDVGRINNTDIGFGGGVVLPVSRGEAYFGLDFIDEMTFGLGYRYFIE